MGCVFTVTLLEMLVALMFIFRSEQPFTHGATCELPACEKCAVDSFPSLARVQPLNV